MDKIIELIKFLASLIWRSKSLIGILSLLVLSLIGELFAIGNSQSLQELFTALKSDENYKNLYYLIWFIEALTVGGSWYTVIIILGIIILISWLKYHEIKSSQASSNKKVSIKAKKVKKVVNIGDVKGDVHI